MPMKLVIPHKLIFKWFCFWVLITITTVFLPRYPMAAGSSAPASNIATSVDATLSPSGDSSILIASSDALFSMSLQELMSVQIESGTITGIARSKTPVARTVITREDIDLTPARSILDLLEVFVPGATFVNHYNGHRFGFRGVLGDQNYHYLLLLNGKNMNLKTQDGPLVEIFNRDLNDIHEIEIIRGPGSVTYGSGAIGGVINIITRTATKGGGDRVGFEADARYRYQTAYASQSHVGKTFDAFLYGSVSRSDGEDDTQWFYVDRAHGYGYGFMSDTWGGRGLGSDEPSYLNDFWDRPQTKLHLDLDFKDGWLEGWHAWGRYSAYSWEKLMEETSYVDGDHFTGFYTQSAVVEVKKRHTLSPHLFLDTSIGFDSVSFREVAGYRRLEKPQEHITNFSNSYSENEWNGQVLLHYEPEEAYRFALGGIVSHEYWRPEWGKDDDSFLMSMQRPIRFAVLTQSSEFYQTYGEDISTVVPHMESDAYSILGEANLAFHRLFHLLISGRADKNDYSDWYYSPRLAVISSPTQNDVIRAVWQRSVRLPNFIELYSMDYSDLSPPDPETLVNYELMVEHTFSNIAVNANLFYNTLDEVSWTERGADVVGTLELFGIESGLTYRGEKDTAGLTYAWTHQIDYDPEVTVPAALTNPDGDPMPVVGYAENRINNLPSHTLQLHWHHRWSDTLKTHINSRLAWGQNQIDLLNMFKDAHTLYGTDASKKEMDAIYDALTSHGYGEPSLTLNASIAWKLPMKLDAVLTVYGMNLISWNHIRYGIQFYEDLSRQYPRQATFIKEPVSMGIKLEFSF